MADKNENEKPVVVNKRDSVPDGDVVPLSGRMPHIGTFSANRDIKGVTDTVKAKPPGGGNEGRK